MAKYIESGTGREVSSGFDPGKFYVEYGTGKQVPGSQLVDTPKGQGGTIDRTTGKVTPKEKTPAGGFGLGGFKEQPKQSSLLEFSNALDQAVNLAKQKRNALSLGMMMPSQGTLMASDFNSILGNLNQASTQYAQSLTSRALEAAKTPTYSYGTATDNAGNLFQVQYDETGRMIGQQLMSAAIPKQQGYTEVSPGATLYDPTTGAAVYTAPTAAAQKAASGSASGGYSAPSTGSGSSGPSMSSKQVTALKNALNASKYEGPEADGKYVDPTLYLQNYESWVAAGGDPNEFFRNFPPSTYINPENKWLPPEIMKFVKKPANSSSGSLDDEIDSLF